MLKKITAAYTLALMGLIVVLGSCKKEYEAIETTDDAVIQQYITANNITATKDTTGFYYQVVSQGDTGTFFKSTDSVFYHVAVKSLANGTVYYTDPVNTNLATYVGYANKLVTIDVPAIRTAMLALKPGGVARVFLPSYLAFGRNGLTNINVPPNEVIDLVITTLPERTQAAVDDRVIREFIAAKNITGMVKHPSGVYYAISAPGSGGQPISLRSSLTVNYTGKTLDGVTFDSSTDGTAVLPLNGVVAGWQEVLPLLKKGGKMRMLIPSPLAYGRGGTPAGTLANTVLDFDVEVLDVAN
ncbi:FKBP-type peptidyl-prolyl cis-trans isomerase [Pedobacter sp. CAN_A7]|uniref:FKBP-type peptidyl-prolyl cis-trans isomerase n=1 Tax=Pedobacter sp. CAN_A7 TaxID=2787722 RepID=UPI0018CB47D2